MSTATESTPVIVLGVTDDRSACECCGKTGLKRVVALDFSDGPVVYYGVDCAAKAIMKSNSKSHRDIVLREAMAMQQIMSHIHDGVISEAEYKKLQRALPGNFDCVKFRGCMEVYRSRPNRRTGGWKQELIATYPITPMQMEAVPTPAIFSTGDLWDDAWRRGAIGGLPIGAEAETV